MGSSWLFRSPIREGGGAGDSEGELIRESDKRNCERYEMKKCEIGIEKVGQNKYSII